MEWAGAGTKWRIVPGSLFKCRRNRTFNVMKAGMNAGAETRAAWKLMLLRPAVVEGTLRVNHY